MVGSGVNAFGSGFELVTGIGGTTERLDHQWNYPRGIPDPRYPGTNRGLSLNRVVYPWVNEHGRRFVAEQGSDTVLKALVQQPHSRAFLIFDDDGKLEFAVAGTDWADFLRIERFIFSNPDITIKANTIDELAAKAGMRPGELNRTIARWNKMLEDGEDLDFGRFSKSKGTLGGTGRELPRAVLRAPFYAVAVYPITRKSMGGVVTDLQSRVLRGDGAPIPGLYAIGEVTGFNGFNGKAALEGTFIAPAMLQGRLVGRAIAAALPQRRTTRVEPQASSNSSEQVIEAPCSTCHDIEKLVATHREGYWHFERVHQVVIENKYECVKCHAEMKPFRASDHKIDRVAQIENCASCHLGDVTGE
jgi:succinate dehydrogenase/fumarate reductase flavoprotein subunit